MSNPDEIARRLVFLKGFEISSFDFNTIAKEIEDNLRIVKELEEFSGGSAGRPCRFSLQ